MQSPTFLPWVRVQCGAVAQRLEHVFHCTQGQQQPQLEGYCEVCALWVADGQIIAAHTLHDSTISW